MAARIVSVSIALVLLATSAASAAAAQTCVTIDETIDALTREERTAAVLLVKKQFALAGHAPGDAPCAATYTVSHLRLGNTIVVNVSGPLGSRQGTALGLDDLPAVYSQIVRSLVTGEPMGSLAVLDRSNVSAAQDLPPRRVQSEGFWHARVGHATMFGPKTHTGASFGFGYRAEFDRFGMDVSFFNVQTSETGWYGSSGGSAMSLVKLEGLYFLSPRANRSAYVGGGLSYGRSYVRVGDNESGYSAVGHGSGLQGELSAGYELARVTSARFFTQADLTLPLYRVVSERYSFPSAVDGRFQPPTSTTDRHYAPSLTISAGIGWQRARR